MDIAMNDFQSKDHRDLLDIIDQLRSQGFSRYIDLPQIIVCGDQSAGKSSVLEAISGMSFPTKDNLCTQFATELILRRHSEKSIKISITPGDDRDPEEKDALLGWRPSFNLDRDGLEAIVEEAKSEMGLSTTRRFCNDILRVELSGPTQPHLTMVDLPGLFKTGNKDQSADNVALVRDMVARYMNRPRSIILAVLSAKNEYVLQEVPSLAKKADPEGLRTIGLITKPDTLDAGSDSERSWVQLAMNKDVELTLGWHVLKNRSYDQKHFTSAERDAAEEEFFSQGIWARLDPSCCMVKNLKHHLSSVLKKQILDQLPSLVHDVEIGIEDCSAKLARLGDTRESPEQQLRYLSGVSQRFSKLMTEATQGIYNDVFFGSPKGVHDYTKRLRAIIQNRLSDFAKEMREFGQSQVITESDGDETYGSRSISRSDYIDHVKIMMSRNRGRELPGLFNPDVINDLFTQQCRPWRRIAVEMTRDIFERVCRAAESIIRHSTADDAADEIVLLVKAEIGDYKTSMDAKVNELLQLHDVLHAITYNPQLTINVQTARRERRRVAMARRVSEIFGTRGFSDVDTKVTINPAQITELLLDEIELDMGRYGTSIAVDYMQAYYALALERFVDDVSIIAVEKCFIDKLPSLLTPNRVLELHPDKIKNLVGESEETTIARTKVVEKLRTLERGLQDIKSFQGHRNASSAAPGTTLTVPVPELRDQSRIDTFPRTPEVGEEVDEASFTGSELREPLPPVSQFMLNRRVFET